MPEAKRIAMRARDIAIARVSNQVDLHEIGIWSGWRSKPCSEVTRLCTCHFMDDAWLSRALTARAAYAARAAELAAASAAGAE